MHRGCPQEPSSPKVASCRSNKPIILHCEWHFLRPSVSEANTSACQELFIDAFAEATLVQPGSKRRRLLQNTVSEHSRLHCGRMRRLLQPSYECFGMHPGRSELVPVPVAPSRLPVPLALSTRRPTAVDTFTGISQILLRSCHGRFPFFALV